MTPTPTVTSRPGIYDQQRPLAHQLLKDIVEAHQTVAQQVIESWLSRMPEAYFRYIFCIYIFFAYTYYLHIHIICVDILFAWYILFAQTISHFSTLATLYIIINH
jgi:hypothetical protein